MDPSIESLRELIAHFQRLPGIGSKTAERLAYHVLRSPAEEALALADAIRRIKEEVRNCRVCSHLAEGELCTICSDDSRDRSIICVVEHPKDLLAIERSGSFTGLYHVLLGTFAPLEGTSPRDLTSDALFERIRREPPREVILATNANYEGEGTALFLQARLKTLFPDLRVSRLARGLPSGSHLEHVGRNIVSDAVEGRREME